MKKVLKITLIVIGIIMGIILIDTLQAIIFDNSPLLKIRDNFDAGSIDYIDKGLFVNHYHCINDENVTTWKKTKFSCSIEENLEESTYNINNEIITTSIKENTLTSSSLTLIFHNNTNETYYYGAGSGIIEKEIDGKWYKLNTIENENIIAIAYNILPNTSKEFESNFGNIYGKLAKGKYRIIKSFFSEKDFHKDGLAESNIYSAVEFEIK